jgi:hypothetical protein
MVCDIKTKWAATWAANSVRQGLRFIVPITKCFVGTILANFVRMLILTTTELSVRSKRIDGHEQPIVLQAT